MAGTEMPSIPQAAMAPLDYSPYGRAATSMAQSGQIIDKAFNDFSVFEKSRDKEKIRVQAINDIVTSKPHMGKVIRPDMTVEELGKGLAQLGEGTLIYDEMAALQKTNPDMALPNKDQYEQAVFKASPEAFRQLVDNWSKQIKETKKGAGSQEALNVFGQIQQEHPDWTQEQINAEAARRNVKPSALESEGLQISQKVAPSAGYYQKERIAEKKFTIDDKKAATYRQKVGDDKFFKDETSLQSSIMALADLKKHKDDAENVAVRLVLQKTAMKQKAEITGSEFNSVEIDNKIKDAYKKSNEYTPIFEAQRKQTEQAKKYFEGKYPLAIIPDTDLEELVTGDPISAGSSGNIYDTSMGEEELKSVAGRKPISTFAR